MSYLVCASQRSGTELLCRGLAATGVAGRPQEYFLAEDPAKLPDWRFWEEGPYAAGHDVSDRESYLTLVYRLGSTPNGVFGAKIHWNCLRWALAKFSEMPRFAGLDRAAILRTAFPDLRVVDVTRRDRVRQAVSWARMAQDGMWVNPVGQPTGVAAAYGPAALRLRAHRRPGGPDRRERDRLAPAVQRARADALSGRLRGAEQPRWLRANDPGRAGSSRTRGLPRPDPGPPDAPSIQRPERGLGSRLPRGQGVPPALTRRQPVPARRRADLATYLENQDHIDEHTGDHGRYTVLCSIDSHSSERSWFMPLSPVPADPGWDEDLTWLGLKPT